MRTIPLKCGEWEALVVPEQAFNLISLRYQGERVLHEPEPLERVLSDPFLFGIPLLFPPNRLEKDGFNHEGTWYAIPYTTEDGKFRLHGRLKSAPITVTRVEENRVEGEFFCDTDRYPFPFKLTITYELTGDGLRTRHVVTNTGEEDMPFAIGFHTSFEAKRYVKVSVGEAWVAEEKTMLPVRRAGLSESQKKYAEGMDPTGVPVDGMFTDSGEHRAVVGRFQYKLSENFTNWVLWNMGGGKGLLCLEPQSAPVNGLNMAGEFSVLPPGRSEAFETEITLA